MADNTDEEHQDISTNTPSENSSKEIIPTTNTETINTNKETENMEVHKHPHHVTHKKKWAKTSKIKMNSLKKKTTYG